MRLISFLLLLASPVVFAQADDSARHVLDTCVESVPHDVAGMDAIEAVCPGIEAALEQLGLASFLPKEQREAIGLNGLRSLQTLVQRYEQPPDTGEMQADSLRSVLDSLEQPAQIEESLSWFERLKRWLRSKIGEQTPAESWLDRWFDEHSLSDEARTTLVYGAMALVVILAIVIVINEARAARKGGRKSKRVSAQQAALASMTDDRIDIDHAAPGDRPSLLLRMLIATLVETGRLQAERSLTHRELTTRARFDDADQRDSFHRVAELAERVVYGGDTVAADDLDDVVRAGRALQSQLSGATT